MLTWFHRHLSVLGLLGSIDSAGFKDLNISTNNLIAPKKHVIAKSQPWMVRIWNVWVKKKGVFVLNYDITLHVSGREMEIRLLQFTCRPGNVGCGPL
jgi:hypothetical protein